VALGLETALEQPDQQHDDYDQRYESASDVHAHTPFAVARRLVVIEKRARSQERAIFRLRCSL
jgi:hypothetical protein